MFFRQSNDKFSIFPFFHHVGWVIENFPTKKKIVVNHCWNFFVTKFEFPILSDLFINDIFRCMGFLSDCQKKYFGRGGDQEMNKNVGEK